MNIGEFAVVAGNDQPTYITAATTGSGATTAITLNEVNKYATAASAPLTVYKACVAGARLRRGLRGRDRPDRLERRRRKSGSWSPSAPVPAA